MKVVFSDGAKESIKTIIDFLSPKISVEKLDEILASIYARTEILTASPYAGQMEEYLLHLNQGHRRLVIGNYKIIYRVNEASREIYITDIFDARQDPAKMKR